MDNPPRCTALPDAPEHDAPDVRTERPEPLRHVWLAIGWIGVALSVYFSLKPHPPELDIQNGDKAQDPWSATCC